MRNRNSCWNIQRWSTTRNCRFCCLSFIMPPPGGRAFWNSAVHLSVPWRSCLGYRHVGCLQLSHRRPPEMCGLRTRPRTDVDPPRFLDRTAIDGGGILSCPQCDTLLIKVFVFNLIVDALGIAVWLPECDV